jgi:hypothetical protein
MAGCLINLRHRLLKNVEVMKRRMIVNYERGVRKKSVVAYFKVLYQHFPGRAEKNNNKPVIITVTRSEFEPGS